MRRTAAALALFVTLPLAVAACSASEPDRAGGGPAASASATAAPGATPADPGAGTKAPLPTAKAAQDKLNKDLDTWSAELRRLAGTAEDVQLKTALGALAAEVERMEATIDSVDDGRLSDVQDRLDALCPV